MNEARKRKNRRLKQAKEEAQQEIEKYRTEREVALLFGSGRGGVGSHLPLVLRRPPTQSQVDGV